jgi:lysophospholipase L1-like esterase
MRRIRGAAVTAVVVAIALGSLSGASHARILVVGDSNAVGLGVPPSHAWTTRLQRRAREFVQVYGSPGLSVGAPELGVGWQPECLFFDTGIFGATARGGVRVAVFALGTNDSTTDLAYVRAGARQTLAFIRAPWVCITPLHTKGEKGQLDPLRQVIREECAAVGARIIEGGSLITDRDLLDDVHLDLSGHAKVAQAVFAALPQ